MASHLPSSSAPDETTFLLPNPASRLAKQPSPSLRTAQPSTQSLWLPEAAVQTRAALPIILAYTLQNSLQTVSVLIAGRLSAEALATAAFSYMFAMSTAWLVALGGTTALDTLAASGFTAAAAGAADGAGLGVLLQRGLLVLSGFYALVATLWWHSEAVFRWLGQEEFICVQSAKFLRCLIPGGLGYIWFEAMKKYLQAQAIYHPGTYVLLFTSPFNALLSYLFIHRLGLGLYGAPIAIGISYWLSFFLLVAYAVFVRGSECWGGLDLRRASRHTGPFARLALMGIMHVGTEWWAFEIVALAAGRLGTVPLAAQSIIMTADQVINTVPFGLGVAVSARVGNLLGARDHVGAARAAHTGAVLSVLVGAAILTVLMVVKNVFGRPFSDNERVVRLVADVLPYYGGALPGGIFLAFHGWGLAGLWVGQCVALYLVGGLQWVIVGSSKWDREVERAMQRLEDGGISSRPQEAAI
ncbi:uncharacterized protein BROUX77_004432 [Berkeleyomyces rouxiae]|uniref:uncharacterized protein n=1 Tax=Berkeleyomyces rouxiae TaxID=2035830 RepID=UPI003B774C0A